jgi:photosystem II stability/assembly factor-like uncharacterized protein
MHLTLATRIALFPLLLVAIVAPLRAQDITQGRWTPLVVFPQNLSLLDFDMLDANRGIAVGANGAVRRTIDGGVNWDLNRIKTNDTLRSVAYTESPRAIAVGDNGAIYRSDDDGATWTRLAALTDERLNVVRSLGGRRLIAAGDAGTLLMSDDGGSTWSAIASNVSTSLRAVGAAGDRAIVVGDAGAILVSSNRGVTWATRASGAPGSSLVDIDHPSEGTWLLTGNPWTVLRSTDDGETWSTIPFSSTQTSDARAIMATAGFFDATHGFIAMDLRYGSLPMAPYFLTDDGGSTWRELPRPDIFDTIRTDIGYSVRAFEATGPDRGVALGTSEAQVTSDRGESWHDVRLGSSSTVRDLHFRDSLNGVLLVLDNSGYGVEGGEQYSVMRTTDAGMSWRRSTVFQSWSSRAFDIVMNGENVFVTSDTGRIYRSSDGGLSWSMIDLGFRTNIVQMRFSDERHGLASGGALFRTIDAGETWTRVDSFTNRSLLSPTPFTPTRWTVFAPSTFIAEPGSALDSARSFTTTDAGQTWTKAMIMPMSGSTAVFLDSMKGFYVGGERDMSFPSDYVYRMTMLRTTDGAASWHVVMDSLPATHRRGLSGLVFADDGHGLLYGEGRVLATTDAGDTWVPIAAPPTRYGSIGTLSYPHMMRAFTTDGESFFRYDVSTILGIERPIDERVPAIAIHPNPAGDIAIVSFDVAAPGQVAIDVVDALGAVRLSLPPAMLSAGPQRSTLQLAGLAPGAYLVRVRGRDLNVAVPLVRR